MVIEDLVVNSNGARFHELFNANCLSVLNIWFTHKQCRRITWHSPDQVTKKIYDFILSCSWPRQYVQNCHVYNSYDFDSDHCLVIAYLCTPCTKVARYKKQHLIPNKKHLNLNSLNDPDVQQNFLETAVNKLESIDLQCNNTMINEQFTTSINKSAEQTLPVLEKPRLYQPWHDDDVLKSFYDLKDQQIAKNADNKQLSSTRRKIRLRSKYLKNEYYKAEADKINQSTISRELDKLFSRAKNQETTLKRLVNVPQRNYWSISKIILTQRILQKLTFLMNLHKTFLTSSYKCRIFQIIIQSITMHHQLRKFKHIFLD